MFRSPDFIKAYCTLRRSQLHFLECTVCGCVCRLPDTVDRKKVKSGDVSLHLPRFSFEDIGKALFLNQNAWSTSATLQVWMRPRAPNVSVREAAHLMKLGKKYALEHSVRTIVSNVSFENKYNVLLTSNVLLRRFIADSIIGALYLYLVNERFSWRYALKWLLCVLAIYRSVKPVHLYVELICKSFFSRLLSTTAMLY